METKIITYPTIFNNNRTLIHKLKERKKTQKRISFVSFLIIVLVLTMKWDTVFHGYLSVPNENNCFIKKRREVLCVCWDVPFFLYHVLAVLADKPETDFINNFRVINAV